MKTDELRELLAKATPGPWVKRSHDGYMPDWCGIVEPVEVAGADGHVVANNETYYPAEISLENAALIVAAINALPELLDRSDRLTAIDAVEVDDAPREPPIYSRGAPS